MKMSSAPDASTVDLTRTRLTLRADLKFSAQVCGDQTFYHVELPSSSEYYRLGYTEYVFLSLLDGRTTFCEALAITARTQGASAFTQQQALSLYSWLLERGVADFADGSSGAGGSRTTKKKPNGNVLQNCNPFWIRIPFGSPDEILKRLQPVLGWLFSPIATVIALGAMVLAALQLGNDWQKFQTAATTVFAPDNWLWLLLAWVVLKSIHEVAHGLTCQRYGGSVRETGIIFAFFAPLAYVDVTSSWGFSSRWQRIHTAAAGMYVELLLASVAVFTWSHIESQLLSHLLYNVIVMASLSTILFNANPLMRFDGYYILSDLLNIPNLYTRSSEAVQQMSGRLLLGVRSTAPAVAGQDLWTLRIYGLAATFWRLLICATLMIAASVFFHGAGVLLAVAGMVAWFGVPVWKAIQVAVRLMESNPARVLRAGVVVSLFVAFTSGILFGLPVPFASTAPGTVELREGCRIRSSVDGFVTSVLVTDGQVVNAGDLLMSLRNDELLTQMKDLALQVRQETVRWQMSMKEHDAGAARVAQGNLLSLQAQHLETQEQVAGLSIFAPTSGRVRARTLRDLANTFVNEGDDLLVVDDGQPRELIVSVAQEDFNLAAKKSGAVIDLRIGTRVRSTGILQRVTPRASTRLTSPALAAPAGGPLAVVAASTDSKDELRLTEPRFQAIVELPAELAADEAVGERGYICLGRPDQSLATYLYDQSTEWLRNQIEMAQSATRQQLQ